MRRPAGLQCLLLIVAILALAQPSWAPPPALNPPGSFTATTASSSQINLAWADTNNSEDGYAIERATSASGPFAQIVLTARNVTSYQDTGLAAGTTYHYRARAKKNNSYSSYTPVANATTSTTPPAAPSGLTATAASCTQVNLAWTDNSSNETGFQVERRPAGGPTWTQIATPGAGVTAFADTTAAAATAYDYRVRATNGAGSSAYSNTASASTPACSSTPAAPSSLSATAASCTQVNLAWTDNSTNETGFKIERRLAGGTWTQIATTGANATSYADTSAAASTAYDYRVRATSGSADSTYSNTASASTPACGSVPAAPTILSASPVACDQVVVSWLDNSTNETGFKVERGPTASGPWTQIGLAGVNATSYTDSTASAATSYFYRVRAYNASGDSTYSAAAVATTPSCSGAPAAPSNLSATATACDRISLTWADNSANETGFKVERAASASGPWTLVATTAANITSYLNTGLAASTTYYYRVRACNALESTNSNTSSAATPACPPTPPAAPSNVSGVSSSCTSINVTWTDNASNENGFKIYRAPGGSTAFALIATLATPNLASYADTSVAATASYQYRARAYNTAGDSTDSPASSTVTTPACSSGSTVWAQRFGGSSTDHGRLLATDASGNLLLAGLFVGAVDFGGGPLAGPGDWNLVLAKYSPTGAHLWSDAYGGAAGSLVLQALATDDAGNFVLAGSFNGTIDLGGGPLTSVGALDAFVAKYSPAGALLWAQRFGSSADDAAYGVGLDSAGNIVLTGSFSGSVSFGGPPLVTESGATDLFLAKLSPTGAHLWSKRFLNSAGDVGYAIALDPLDNIFLAGSFSGVIDFGGGFLTSAGLLDAFLAKFSPTGAYLWSRRAGSSRDDVATRVAVDPSGDVVIAGWFHDSIDLGGGPLAGAGLLDIFVAKYAGATGAHRWSRTLGGGSNDVPYGLAVDAADDVLLTGAFQFSADFGAGPRTSAGLQDIFVVKYTGATGAHRWSRTFGSTGPDVGYAVATDPLTNDVTVTGSFSGTVNFGTAPLTSAGGEDAVMLKLSP